MRVDLTRQYFETGEFVNWPAIFDVTADGIGLILACVVGSAPLDHETCHLKVRRSCLMISRTDSGKRTNARWPVCRCLSDSEKFAIGGMGLV